MATGIKTSQVLLDARKLPSGARFYRCALQVNPHHYAKTYRGKASPLDEPSYVEQMIAEAERHHVEVIGIADHNNTRSVAKFASAAAAKGITVFPGFEASSSEGVHVLCLFPPGTSDELLGRHLGELGVKGIHPSPELSDKSFSELLQCVVRAGGVAIAAHVTESKGLLTTLHGSARAKAWKDSALLAVQIPGLVDELPVQYKAIVRNTDPEYERVPARGKGLGVAVINAKDVKAPEDLADHSATTLIKMSSPTIDGLKQAFLDPDSRIRFIRQEVPAVRAEIVAVAWESGFLDGCAIHFNDNLNVLIGGRGAGKTSIIESIRWALGQQPIGDEAISQHDSIVRHVAPSGTKVSLLLRTREPDERMYVVERTAPNPPVVRDESGQISTLAAADLLRAEIYGQHELSELARDEQRQTRLLQRFVEPAPGLSGRKAELRRTLERSRRQLLAVAKELADVRERLAALPQIEETLKRYQDAGVEGRLKEQSLLVREERVLITASDRIARFSEFLETLRREIPPDTAFLSDKALEELPGKAILLGAREALHALAVGATEAFRTLERSVAEARSKLDAVRTTWTMRKQGAQAEYEKVLRELQKTRIDGAQFVELRKALEDLRPLAERQVALERDLKVLQAERTALVTEWEDAKSADFRRLDRATRKIEKELEGLVKVRVVGAGSRAPLLELLTGRIGGNLAVAKRALDRDLSLTEFAAACRAGKAELIDKFGLSPAIAERIAQAGPEFAMEVEELELPTTTEISLNIAGEGKPTDFHALRQLSAGQQATALLLIVLLESEGPLIVDQPEDDLDNRFIYEGVVPRMREEKRRRQFLFATHNANIPVLGDAELIVGVQAAADRARMDQELMGSIDATPVRKLVEELLEGGKHAFELRRAKYGYGYGY